MDKIQKEEYVRTADGKIGIFDRYSSRPEKSLYKSPFNCFIKLKNRKTPLQCCRDYIVKHSKNIIDLIEVGDILKLKDGEKWEVQEHQGDGNWIQTEWEVIENEEDFKNKVDSILTHEQFSSLEYII